MTTGDTEQRAAGPEDVAGAEGVAGTVDVAGTDGVAGAEGAPRRPLFRPEAVEHHARGATERRILDLGERRTAWFFRFLLLLLATLLLVAFTVRADESAKGTTTVVGDGRAAALVLPIGALRRLAPGQQVRVTVDGHRVFGHVASIGEPVAGGPSAVVPAVASLDEPLPLGGEGQVVVRIGRHTLAQLFLGRRGG
ncbi:MAG: hypothetical protein QOE45_1185 [Frankiaceae bacterium]|nr:hypothetical protein [Frankiaceae bacterium]